MTTHKTRLGRAAEPESGEVVMSVRMPRSLADALYDLAREDGNTLSSIIRTAMREHVNRRMSNLVPVGVAETSGSVALIRTWRHAR